ncbi:hypothetical protein ACFO9Q_22440 [Paenibacillus sp. GCM10023252]|uniref:hypothetical protein n=1 Tax=Paenibacillus sp. GCM10023252 TaxID=3252649 RepID=UPI0036077D2E
MSTKPPKIPDEVLENNNNSSMAQNEKEMKKLGDEMKHMKTNRELEAENLIPDPQQD